MPHRVVPKSDYLSLLRDLYMLLPPFYNNPEPFNRTEQEGLL